MRNTAVTLTGDMMGDKSFHDRMLERELDDPDFRTEFEREKREIETIDGIVNALGMVSRDQSS